MNHPTTECKTYGPEPIGVAPPLQPSARADAALVLASAREFAAGVARGYFDIRLGGGAAVRVRENGYAYVSGLLPNGEAPISRQDALEILAAVAG